MPHGLRPNPDPCKFCTKSGGGPPPLLKLVKKILKGGPLLLHHLSYTTDTILPGLGTVHASWPSAKSPRMLALGHNNPTVCSLACRWRLWSALWADRDSFSIDNPRGLQLKARLYSSELSYSFIVHYLHPSRVECSSGDSSERPILHILGGGGALWAIH